MSNPILVEATRGQLTESYYRGAFVIADAEGSLLASQGNTDMLIYARSSIKALQCIPLVESGAADRYGLGEAEIALACASHDGEPFHIEALERWREHLGVSYEALECGAVAPTHKATRLKHNYHNMPYTPLHAPCSGKHLGFLTTALHLGVTIENYHHRLHPIQQRVEKVLEEMTGLSLAMTMAGSDGCRIPVLAMPLSAIAKAMARFSGLSSLSSARGLAAQRILQAIAAYPLMVGGTTQFTSRLIEVTQGDIIVKVGAEGVFTAVWPARKLGFALKIESGHAKAAEVALGALLKTLGALTADQEEDLQPYLMPVLENNCGESIGCLRPAEEWQVRLSG